MRYVLWRIKGSRLFQEGCSDGVRGSTADWQDTWAMTGGTAVDDAYQIEGRPGYVNVYV